MYKKKALVLGGTSDQSFALGTFLLDFKVHCSQLVDEIVIYHDGFLSRKDMEIMHTIFPCHFIKYAFPLKKNLIPKGSNIHYFSQMLFCKFECLTLLNKYRTVIFPDYDVVLLDNLQELCEPSHVGAKMFLAENAAHESFTVPLADYKMDGLGMAAGLIVFEDSLKKHNEMLLFCYNSLQKYSENLYLPEQAIFNIMLQHFDLKPEKLAHKTYAVHPSEQHLYPNAKILHAYGQPKFWNGLNNSQWNDNYSEWIKLGGSKIPSTKFPFLKKVIKKLVKLACQA